MALQISYVDIYGNTNSAAYVRVHEICLEDGRGASIKICVYRDAASRSKGNAPSEKMTLLDFHYSLVGSDFTTYFADGILDDNNKSPLKQAYAYLKTSRTPIDFSGATDV